MKDYKSGERKIFDPRTAHQYEYFLPSLINRDFAIGDTKKILTTLEEAVRLLGELNAYGSLVPDVNFFIQMHVISEAVSSSRIEGTKTGLDDALLSEDEIAPDKKDDWQEVKNYITAMNQAIQNLNQLPVSERFIKETHKTLLSGVRGEHKLPGEIRNSQNWIGGASINSAHFIPPHQQHLPELLSDWEKFWHNNSLDIPVLLKIAIGHYQFETIHPFCDGNGRIGRLLISLQLIETGFLKYPVLYISDFFEKHRQSYYDSLDKVRNDNDLDQWILFFLDGVIETSKKSKETFENIIKLREIFENKISTLGKKTDRGRKLLFYLFSDPIVNINEVEKTLGVQYAAANNLVQDFINLGILKEKSGYSRNRYFAMDDYIKLFGR
ncbi:MAG TPA: Fic family protein [Candidatus Kaiserbacteria bacterium]|nr:Fic family protein [Candidatus Kaiserbacteria bacterium]